MERVIRSVSLQTFLRYIGVAGVIALVAFYVHFQARNLLSGPTITLTTGNDATPDERTLMLSGETQNIVKLTMNGREIHTDERGFFTEALVLENGYTVVTLVAEDRFGRDTTLTRKYVYTGTGNIN